MRRIVHGFLVSVFGLSTTMATGCRSSQVWFSDSDDLTTVLTDHMGTSSETLDVAV